MTTIALIGAGRMGSAMLDGWLNAEAAGRVLVIEPDPSPAVRALAQAGRIMLRPEGGTGAAAAVVVAIKPQTFPNAAAALRGLVGPGTLVVSIMAGLSLSAVAEALGAAKVVRAMPNTPGAIGHGVTSVVFGDGLDAADRALACGLLAPLGDVEALADEGLMDAATAVAGCGPAYVFLLAEAMTRAGEAAGLAPDLALRLAVRTVAGAGALMATGREPPEALRAAVTSPNGVTAEALAVLMRAGGLPDLMDAAVQAAIARSRELGR